MQPYQKQIKQNIERFYQEYNRFPTSHDFDTTSYLPTARTIQRKFGGLVKLRQELGYAVADLRNSKERKEILRNSKKDHKKIIAEITIKLNKTYSHLHVHTPYTYIKQSLNLSDFEYHTADTGISSGKFTSIINFFNVSTTNTKAVDIQVRHKIKKMLDKPVTPEPASLPHEWVIVCANPAVKTINYTHPKFKILTYSQFVEEYIDTPYNKLST